MPNIILPDDPDFDKPITWGDAYEKTPKGQQQKRLKEFEKAQAAEPGIFKYAASQIAHQPDSWMKTAQTTGANTMMTQPMWFSPLHTPQNWQIASKRREIYQWCFISDDENPCFLTNYGDFSLIDIREVFEILSSNLLVHDDKEVFLQNHLGKKAFVDVAAKRDVVKQANKIKVIGTFLPTIVTSDHKCIVIKSEQVKCKYHPRKNCIGKESPTCRRYNCDKYKTVDYEISKVDAKDVQKGDYFLIPICRDIQPSIIRTKEQARFAGHLASDGWVCDGNNRTGFKNAGVCMNYEEEELILPTIESVFDGLGLQSSYVEHTQSNVLLKRSSSKALYEFASTLVKGKSTNKKFTDEVMLLSPKLQMHVLGAYIQSDGSYNKRLGQIEITTISPHLANQLLTLFYRCGTLAFSSRQPVSRSSKTFKTENKYRYIVSVPASEVHKFYEYCPGKIPNIRRDERPQRTHNKRFFWKDYVVTPITSNEKFDYKGPVYDVRAPGEYTITVNGTAIHQCRFWYENEPKVAAAIDFYSRFPMNGFRLECPNSKILNFFDHHVVNKLDLNEMCKQISSEYFMLGDVFIHMNIQCPECNGTGKDLDTGEVCNHPGGLFNRMVVLNPDWIEVQQSVMAEEPSIVFIPDEELKNIVFYRQPKALYDRIPMSIRDLVIQGKPIPLSNRTTSHLKHMPVPYGTYGTSLSRRLFVTLAYKTKIMTANWIVAERLILPVRVVKIGSDNRPATGVDIADMQQQLAATANDPNLTIVTHHNLEYEWYGACYDSETEFLTKNGWVSGKNIENKPYDLLVYDPNTRIGKFEKSHETHIYNYDGELTHFEGKRFDICVTPNHRMLVHYPWSDPRIVEARDVKPNMRFTQVIESHSPEILPPVIETTEGMVVDIEGDHIPILPFMKFVGYYLAEGHSVTEKGNWQVQLSQDERRYLNHIKTAVSEMGYNGHDYNYRGTGHIVVISNKKLAKFMSFHFGNKAINKHIPSWFKQLPANLLHLAMESMLQGDGHKRTTLIDSYLYSTVSKSLQDDFQEIAFYCGFSTRSYNDGPQGLGDKDLLRTHISRGKAANGQNPIVRSKHIKRLPYKGKVWCFTTSTGLFVTRRNGKITIQGNTGKILQVTQELEWIGKEILDGFMLNQSLLNGEMCLPPDHEVLTATGYKPISEVTTDDSICVWVDANRSFRYEKPQEKYTYDKVEELYEIKSGDKVLFRCTGDHKIVVWPYDQKGRWHITVPAKEICDKSYSYKTLMKDGSYVQVTSAEKIYYGGSVYCFKTSTGYFVAKYQDIKFISGNSGYQCHDVEQTEVLTREGFKKYDDVVEDDLIATFNKNTEKIEYRSYLDRFDYNHSGEMIHFNNEDVDVLVTENHRMLIRNTDSHYPVEWQPYEGDLMTHSPLSTLQVNEITSRVVFAKDIDFDCEFLSPYLYDDGILNRRVIVYHDTDINYQPFKGRVFCFTVPNGFFITRRNGKIAIHGNSAQVGVETLIRRIESWRQTLKEWCEEKIFKPIAMMHGFIDEKKSDEVGETVYIYPEIKWNDLELKDKTQRLQYLSGLHDKQLISGQTLLEESNLDYDLEVHRMRKEQMMAGPAGAPLGGGAGMGAPGGGMGGAPGGAPGGDMGMGGMAPGGAADAGMMGGAGAGGMAPGGGMAPSASSGKIMKAGKGVKADEMMPQMMPINLTEIEQKMAGYLEEVAAMQKMSPQNIRAQFPVENPTGQKPYQLDFAIPHIKLALECDGDIYHSGEQAQDDQKRDYLLAQRGWTILRFDDKTIHEEPQQVKQSVNTWIKKLYDGKKKASCHLYTIKQGEMIDLGQNYDEYTSPWIRDETGHNGEHGQFRDVKYSNSLKQSEVF